MATTQSDDRSKPWLNQPNAVWRRISDRIEERMAIVERAVVALLGRPLQPAEKDACSREVELLAQWLFALDLVVAGRLARELGDVLDDPKLSSRAASGLATRVEELRRVLRVAGDDWRDAPQESLHIHLVSPIDAHIDATMWHLQQRGALTTHSPTFMSAPERADAIVVYTPTSIRDASGLLNAVGRRSEMTRRVIIHDIDVPRDNLAAVSNEADLVLSFASPAKQIADEIFSIAQPEPDWVNRVVLLGANDLYRHLRPYGFEALLVDDVDNALRTMASAAQVLLVGPDVRDPSSVVSLVRATPSTRHALIAVASVDPNEVARARQMGADIIIDNQDEPDGWALHLRGLLTRRRNMTEFSSVGVVSVQPWALAAVLFDRTLSALGRSSSVASLALIDTSEQSSDDRAALYEALATEFRTDDLLGEAVDGRLMVLLKGAPRGAAAIRMQKAVDRLHLPQTPGRSAVVEFPSEGLGLGNLLEAADELMGQSVAAAGPPVVSADWAAAGGERVDVMLVESDLTLSTVLGQLLDRMGLTSRHVMTGSDALNSLTGTDAVAAPRLLLLELDAMGADGLMVLRSLARHQVLSKMKVVVTCSRVRDGELREAFELGAADVIPKPFSAVVLSNRIANILAAS